MPAKVELIAYADRFGGDLAGLRALLNGPLRGLFGGVHVLPVDRPYDGPDAGADPRDLTEIDERLGSWDDIAALSAEYRVMTDVDIRHPAARDYLPRIIGKLAAAHVSHVGLDAIGYPVKTPDPTSFMTPDMAKFIGEVTAWCHDRGLKVLVELHSHYLHQVEIAQQVDYVYDFALPPLILHALTAADPGPLLTWQGLRPANAVTVLDTHDGIGIIDVGPDAADRARPGLLGPDELAGLVEAIHANSGGASRQATGTAASDMDLYQVNCTFYDALGRDDDRYLLARALQFWTPGIPQVYYVGLLAGENDMDLIARTHVGRDVNRHSYQPAEVEAALARPVVRALGRLIGFRNAHPAFEGSMSCSGNAPNIEMTWARDGDEAVLRANLADGSAEVTWTENGTPRSAPLAALP